MADAKLTFFSFLLLFTLIFAGVRADAEGLHVAQEIRSHGSDDSSALKIELEQLKSKNQLLETHLEETNTKLKAKDEKISQLEKAIQEKSDNVASLQSEIESLEKKGTSDAEERVGRAHARATELQKQIEKLRRENEGQSKEKDALEVQAKESEKKVEELSTNIEKLQKIHDEQKTRIRKTERALQVAEEEMMRAKLEANSRTRELMKEVEFPCIRHSGYQLYNPLAYALLYCRKPLIHHLDFLLHECSHTMAKHLQALSPIGNYYKRGKNPVRDFSRLGLLVLLHWFRETPSLLEIRQPLSKAKMSSKCTEQRDTIPCKIAVHGAWLPPWLFDHLIRSRSFIETEWTKHGKPIMEVLVQKAIEKKDQLANWAEPHVETIKTKWAPAVKEQWLMAAEYIEPHLQSLKAKTAEIYEASKTAIKPHIIKVQELTDPYYQNVKKFSKPYVNQVATVAKPHVQKARTVLKPYTKKAIHVYGKFLESATMYHHQIQATVHEKLKQHELTRPLATKELVWRLKFGSDVVLSLKASALLALPVITLSRICSSKKPKKPARSHHTRRKGKRGHPDK
ncbi:hypothetical protein Cgig2_011369 [Carnegiea gigantea]|uniref:Uncharacterized protein n=1 Tax=Carnegiea gigantea TaxID=171969 RepID=A0A9Q1KSF7_9CARY|nr:hypothetical protein Cgig2_011369 [Carnegiea gigantea]